MNISKWRFLAIPVKPQILTILYYRHFKQRGKRKDFTKFHRLIKAMLTKIILEIA
jgi:hypothetical protein